MKTRMLFAALFSLSALTASASDDGSPFYRNPFVVDERPACARPSPLTAELSPFYRNPFVTTRAVACSGTATPDRAEASRAQPVEHARAPQRQRV